MPNVPSSAKGVKHRNIEHVHHDGFVSLQSVQKLNVFNLEHAKYTVIAVQMDDFTPARSATVAWVPNLH